MTSEMYRFKTKPYAHQQEAWDTCKDKDEYALFMEMGTGKSKVIIDNIAWLYDKGKIDSVVIVAPKGAYLNWSTKEIPEHMPEHVLAHVAVWAAQPRKKDKEALDKLRQSSLDLRILIINVEAFSTAKGYKFVDKFLTSCMSTMMIVDESTTIKNPSARRTKNLIKLGNMTRYRRILTGEPVTRSPLDLYTQLQFLNSAILGFSSYYSFRNRYAVMIDQKLGMRSFKKIVGYQRLTELSSAIGDYSYRCLKDQCLDLPAKTYQYRYVTLTPEQKKLYNQVSDFAIGEFEGEVISASNALVQLLRLHQITCGNYTSDSGEYVSLPNNRIQELLDVLDEAPSKVIIWATYINDLMHIKEAIVKKYGAESMVMYYGGINPKERPENIKRFQEDPDCRFFVGNPQTGGMGITLTAANTVVYYSNSHNLEHRLQSEDRAHRIGQTKNVNYVDLVCPGTIDEKIIKALRSKKQVASTVMNEQWRDWLGPVRN